MVLTVTDVKKVIGAIEKKFATDPLQYFNTVGLTGGVIFDSYATAFIIDKKDTLYIQYSYFDADCKIIEREPLTNDNIAELRLTPEGEKFIKKFLDEETAPAPFKKGFTHGGVFHADDVFSSALLRILNPSIVIERGFKVPENYDGIVFDIGLGEFDHHQADNEVRENGVPYASFGKLWRKFGPLLCSEKAVEDIDSSLVQTIDNTDNTGEWNPLSAAIRSFNPNWDSNESSDAKFNEAVSFAMSVLSNMMDEHNSKDRAASIVESAYNAASKKELVVFDQYVPASEYLIDTEALFYIYPSIRGGYNIQTVPKSIDEYNIPKKPFPEAWGGKTAAELQELSGISGLTFCHKGLFLCSASTFDDAIKVAEYCLLDNIE